MSARDLILGEAELDSEEDDASFGSEADRDDVEDQRPAASGSKRRDGAVTKGSGSNGDKAGHHFTDSSDEDDDEDDDEDAVQAVREGFIVDEEDEEEVGGDNAEQARQRRRRERKKRRREEREEEEANLDDEDLDLIGEANPEFESRRRTLQEEQPKLKRLKQGNRREETKAAQPKLVGQIFDDDDDEAATGGVDRAGRRVEDEFDDFIEEDFSDGLGGIDGQSGAEDDDDDAAVRRKPARRARRVQEASGLDEMALEDMKEVFGDGLEYDWALEAQDAADAARDQIGNADEDAEDGAAGLERPIELKHVFEPSQLVDRLLTDEDNAIRTIDEPERFQIARKPHKNLVMTEEDQREEALWISDLMLPKKRLQANLREPFQRAVAKVLEFMNVNLYEVPFIFQHRKDYLIHASKTPVAQDPNNPQAMEYVITAEKLLTQSDLWDILDHDLKFRALVEKRRALQQSYQSLQNLETEFSDEIIEECVSEAQTLEELQDIQDYMHFQHVARFADANAMNVTEDVGLSNGTGHQSQQRRPGASKSLFERVRSSPKVYSLVRSFGITADAFAKNASQKGRRRHFAEDPSERPDDLADSDAVLDPPHYSSGAQCLRAAKAMFAEEVYMNPRMRKFMRQSFFMNATIDCHRTEKGLKKIDEQHPYAEIKYLRNQQLADIAADPARFLRMLRAEEEGLLEVRVRMQNKTSFVKDLYKDLESDNYSEIADAWNQERREALDLALIKLEKMMAKSLKEAMRSECENQVAKICRDEYGKRLDQAPYKPKGMQLGTIPRVLAMSNGTGTFGREAICWVWVDDDGRVLENGKFIDLNLGEMEQASGDGEDVEKLVELIQRRPPDVIGVSGFSAETRKLYKQLDDIVERRNLKCAEYDDDNGNPVVDRLEVIIVNDEVARLYQNSERATMEHPGLAPLSKYCVGLAKYVQNPMIEYAALGRDIVSISFDPNQQYIPQEKLIGQLETAMVDMVNLCGVDINEALNDSHQANLLPYVCGLGPRKAAHMLKMINLNGGELISRSDLVGDVETNKLSAMGAHVWANCASFLYIIYDSSEGEMDYLDNTRVHPEDYDIGRKMAADALELDEEDIEAEMKENGAGAVVHKLIRDEAQDKVNDLILEEYAEQLEKNFNQRKRATLETIRAELQQPYEELRRNFALLSSDEIFTMLTGETRESLCEGMIVPVSIKKVADDYIDCKMDCGIEGTVPAMAISTRADISAKQLFSMHQTVQAKITYLNRKQLTANFSLREDELARPYRRELHDPSRGTQEWDHNQEHQDRESLKEKSDVSGRAQRVVKHPLFRPFNATEAEEYLGSQARGDLVIRPSSKGPDHLAVTWKVSDNVYQHLDVLELDKAHAAVTGISLRVGGRDNYSDLDELIVNHVKAMAKKVDEMMLHEKFQNSSKTEVERWLTTYTEANPKRSVYGFCIDPKHPGYFYLCFKAGHNATVQHWYVKVVPRAYELQKNLYPDMKDLCNGFKRIFGTLQAGRGR